MLHNKSIIVIPIYKSDLTEIEIESLRQLIKVLGHYTIVFFTHSDLDMSAYKYWVETEKVQTVFFPKNYFKSTATYNRLLLSKDFYKRFEHSDYILIYQLDAWVFKDELDFWCQQGYDYIGAPWYTGFSSASENANFFGIGNGGFSIRNVAAHLKVLNQFSFVKSWQQVWQEKKDSGKVIWTTPFSAFHEFFFGNNTFHLLNKYDQNEDAFWGYIMPQKFKWFTVPDEHTAAKFSMEVNAPNLYEELGRELPFGCHAWEKYHTDFWKKHIQIKEKQL